MVGLARDESSMPGLERIERGLDLGIRNSGGRTGQLEPFMRLESDGRPDLDPRRERKRSEERRVGKECRL